MLITPGARGDWYADADQRLGKLLANPKAGRALLQTQASAVLAIVDTPGSAVPEPAVPEPAVPEPAAKPVIAEKAGSASASETSSDSSSSESEDKPVSPNEASNAELIVAKAARIPAEFIEAHPVYIDVSTSYDELKGKYDELAENMADATDRIELLEADIQEHEITIDNLRHDLREAKKRKREM